MDKKKAIEIARKNAVSIACGVVALIAVGLVFLLLSGMFHDLATRMEASREAYDTMKQLNGKSFDLPKLDLNNPGAATLVDVKDRPAFPTPAAIAAGEKIVRDLQANAKQLMDLAIRYNQKLPLVRRALPDRDGPGAAEFKNRYYATLQQFQRDLGATTTVTQAEVDMEKARIWKTDWAGRVIMVGGLVKNPQQEQQVKAEFEEKVVPTIGPSLQLQRAQRHTMYISDPNAHAAAADALAAAGIQGGGGRFGGGFGAGNFGGANPGGAGSVGLAGFSFDYHPGIPPLATNQLPDILDIWAAQIGLWIQEDVVKAIVQSNVGKRSVRDAVIKRLVRIDIPKEYITRKGRVPMTGTGVTSMAAGRGRQPVAAATDVPVVTANTAAALARDYTFTPTGRICNSVYDVVHFNVKVDIDPTHYEAFIANLTNNRFITILRTDMKAVDREEAMQNGFVYAGSPVVQLDLKCEAIFFRQWTSELVPKEIKQLLQVAEQTDPLAGF